MTRKYVYFLLIRLDYYILFFIFLIKSQKEKALGVYFGNYYFFFFFIQPIVYLFLREDQKTNIFLNLKILMMCLIFYSFFILIENILLPHGYLFSLFYIPLFILYIYIEGSFKFAYRYFLRISYKETFFEYFSFHSDKFYFEKNVNKLERFKEEINDHSIKAKVSIFKKKKKKLGELLEDILFLKKEKKFKMLKDQRKNEINDYLILMKKINLEKKGIHKNFSRSNFNTLKSFHVKNISIRRDKKKISSQKKKKENNIDINLNISKFFQNNNKKRKKTKLEIFTNIIFFPFIFLFKYTLPDKNINKTYKKFFFGIIIILIYKIALIISLFYLLNYLQEITKISDLIKGLILSIHNLSYLLYLIYSPILNNYFLYNTLQEMSSFDIVLSGTLSGIINIFLPNTIQNNYFSNLCRFSTFYIFMIFFFVVVIYNKSFFPIKMNFLFFFGFIGIFIEEYFIN